jgi:parallel beta-helix repeat protein
MSSRLAAVAIIPSILLTPGLATAKVTKVDVYPSFETAGVIITLDQDPGGSNVTLQIKGPGGSFKPAHPFVRYDARHMASSLFNLKPGTAYTIQVGDGGGQKGFVTRKHFQTPLPKRVVNVSDQGQLQSAIAAAQPGDRIVLAAGNYQGGLKVTSSGTQADPIVITGQIAAQEQTKHIHQRSGLPRVAGASGTWGIDVTGSYVVVENLRVENNSGGGIRLKNAHHCVVRDNQVYDNGRYWNILVEDKSSFNLIQHNHSSDLNPPNFVVDPTGSDPSVTEYGIKIDNYAGPGTMIRYNRVEKHYNAVCPCINEEETQNVGENNQNVLAKWNNHNVEVQGNTMVNLRGDAIEADGICVNARIHNNWVGRSSSPTSISPSLPGPYFFVRNRITDYTESCVKFNTGNGRGTIRNIFYYHNTIKKLEADAVLYLWDGTPSKDVTFRNNIFVGPDLCVTIQSDWDHKPDMDYNLWHSPMSSCFSYDGGWDVGWSGWKNNSGNESHGVWANPQLSGKLMISAGSAAIDKGVIIPGINDDYSGAGPDIGANEVGLSHPPDTGPQPRDLGPPPITPDGPLPPGWDSRPPPPPGDKGVTPKNGGGGVLGGGCSCTLASRWRWGLTGLGVWLLLAAAAGLLLQRRRRR